MRLFTVPAALFAALTVVACDAGTKPTATGGPGPILHFAAPRMDAVFPIETRKEKEKDKDGKETGKEIDVEVLPKVEVLFDLMNYATGRVDQGGNGQHVHLIVDNEPYQAIYDVTQATKLEPKYLTKGTHILRAFPSAGPNDAKGALEHESRKNDNAFAWVRFHVGAKGGDLSLEFDPAKPMLTYSRPKGDYTVGSPNHQKFMIDWFQTNVTLAKGGLHVSASLDGKKLGDYVEWKPVVLETPPAVGEHVLKLELLDRDDRVVSGPFNSTERKFKVVEKAAR
jgi:hypothetical protein